ncbi:MAG: ATP-binding protein [Sedimentisphaerales bacterium]|nr:ATP-binding protein [Sedimentisphaerales bacterium]
MIERRDILNQINKAFRRGPVVALLGPRQCGKTTLAREFVPADSQNYFDLEDPVSMARLAEPRNVLSDLKGMVVIDEVQRYPELFPILRVLADRKPSKSRFLILGSASVELIKHSSESLAGRMARVVMSGFSLDEVGKKNFERHWLRGGFPKSFLAGSDNDSLGWRKDFIQSFIEKDLPSHGMALPPATLLKFWTMLAHYHGQVWNAADPAQSLGISEMTVKRYLDILSGVFMVRQLQPWHANIKKRQVKAPKIYIRDEGILHSLLGIRSKQDLSTHPKYGASWEGYVIEEVIRTVEPDDVYYWRTHSGAEIDLVFRKGRKMYGIECKRHDAPRMNPSIKSALEDLKLEAVAVVYPGDRRYILSSRVFVVPFGEIDGGMKSLFSKAG